MTRIDDQRYRLKAEGLLPQGPVFATTVPAPPDSLVPHRPV